MEYKYETHLHTSHASACSKMTGVQAADYYKSLGFTGVFVTDHFLNGNTNVPKTGDWETRISLFCEGYKATLKRGLEIGLDVFFGFEFHYAGTHFLIYNLDENWLISHPEIMDIHPQEFLKLARDEGAFIVQAHPFREAHYIKFMRLFPKDVDAVEYLNASDTDEYRTMAKMYAEHYGLPGFAGSDAHFINRDSLSGIVFETRIKNSNHFVSLLRSGKYRLFADNY